MITSACNGAGEILAPGETGTVLADPADGPALVEAILEWRRRRVRVAVDDAAISMERNLRGTLAVLERAAAERRPPARGIGVPPEGPGSTPGRAGLRKPGL
mgnify:CR=1 FL=1